MVPTTLKLPAGAAAAVFLLAPAVFAGEPSDSPTLPPLRIAELMTSPLVDVDVSGEVWVRNRASRVCFADGAAIVHPIFGADAAREWPVRFTLQSVVHGRTAISINPIGEAIARESTVELQRTGLVDVYHLRLDDIEQTFVFDELPGSGDLVLTIDVETDLDAVDGDVISFAHPTRGEVRYGRAFAYDAEGRRIEIERTLDGRSIRLVVPADFVAGATLPLTVDPPISTFTSTPTTVRAKSPDITYCGSAQRYFVCWEEETSSTNSDVFVTSFDRAGNGGGLAVAESGNASWTTPRIAYSAASDRLLVVADASIVVIFPDNAIAGRLFDPSTLTAVGASFPIGSGGFDP
ncbi:MAG: hypothetical protein AAGA20_00425, partial [Planctomycetota bacterium]